MLDLRSSRWSDLSHAYGSAADIPNLLRQLESAPPQENYKSEPWYSIWSSLCHQGGVYSATYAAMPHIIEVASRKGDRERFDCLNFVGYAEACRHRAGAPPIPADLKDDYLSAIDAAPEIFLACLKQKWDEEETKTLLGGFAAIKGYPKLGDVIIRLDSTLTCLECEGDLSSGNY
jgi:hypothetical protein